MRSSPNFLLFLFFLLFLQCNRSTDQTSYERAHDPWVFRSVLDGQPRMVTLALNDRLWAAYSTETGALYKVWKGSVNFDGAVYTTVHGPQPGSLGDAYFVNAHKKPWIVETNGVRTTPGLQYRGHRFDDGQVVLHYELTLDGGTVVSVEERPEYRQKETGQNGFERSFTIKNLPSGAGLILQTNLSSIALEQNIQTQGAVFRILRSSPRESGKIMAIDVEGELVFEGNGTGSLTTWFTRMPLIENENKVVGAEEEEERPLGYRLIARSDCKSCHNTYVQTVGPAYVDVARKYSNNEQNISRLISKVKNGGAGVWGVAAMTAHPDLEEGDIRHMVEYIMGLDAEEEAQFDAIAVRGLPEDMDFTAGVRSLTEDELVPGAIGKLFIFEKDLSSLADVDFSTEPAFEVVVPVIQAGSEELQELGDNFAILLEGYLNIPKNNNYTFRLRSDDGSRLIIDDMVIIDHDGLHGADPKDGEIALEEGYHPFRLEYFQAKGGKEIRLEWRSFDGPEFQVVPAPAFVHHRDETPANTAALAGNGDRKPGDATPLLDVHPSYDLSQARPDDFLPKVAGMDFLSDGRLVVSTWDAEGAVFIIDNVQSGDPSEMSVKKVASGLAEPLGLKVVEDTIYVLQKQELTKLIDHDGDELIDEYFTVSNRWRVSDNFHEFAFGLVYKDGWFYGALAIAILPGGASANPQIPDRGKAIRINRYSGEMEIIAEGLRTPNGVGIGADGEIFIADNQGDWLPSSKILHVTPGAFFGSRAVDSARVANLPVKLPVVWLPQDEIGNSPTTPAFLNDGPYKGQMIHGEVTHGGVKRVFVEKVDGEYQGAVFRFTQGLEAGINRIAWGPDGALYVGGVGSTGNWGHAGKQSYGLQRLKYNGKSTFEMLAVRARSNGVEIELTEPLKTGLGTEAGEYEVQQWYYLPTHNYGGPKLGLEDLNIRSVNISEDRKKIFLELEGMKENHVLYIHLPFQWTSDSGQPIWSTEAWYTMNRIPGG